MSDKKDLVLNAIANPDYSMADFADMGYTPDNTIIGKKEVYYNSKLV
jgi:hypothetical protein